MIRDFLANYLPRHRNRTNRLLHLIGVPLSFMVAPVLAVQEYPWFIHMGCFAAGYLLQFAGHAVEGNDAGEVVFFKRMLGLSYNEYAQGANGSSTEESADDTTSAVK